MEILRFFVNIINAIVLWKKKIKNNKTTEFVYIACCVQKTTVQYNILYGASPHPPPIIVKANNKQLIIYMQKQP